MTLGSVMVNMALARARDPQGMATPAAPTALIPLWQTALGLASTAQQVVNGIIGDVITTSTIQLQPRTLIYQLSAFVPLAVKVHAVRDASGRDLDYMEDALKELSWVNTSWVQQTASEPRCWAMVGRDVLVVYPAPKAITTITVVFTQLTPVLNSVNDSTVVQNETDNLVTGLTEMLLLLKSRDYEPLKMAFERWMTRTNELKNTER